MTPQRQHTALCSCICCLHYHRYYENIKWSLLSHWLGNIPISKHIIAITSENQSKETSTLMRTEHMGHSYTFFSGFPYLKLLTYFNTMLKHQSLPYHTIHQHISLLLQLPFKNKKTCYLLHSLSNKCSYLFNNLPSYVMDSLKFLCEGNRLGYTITPVMNYHSGLIGLVVSWE